MICRRGERQTSGIAVVALPVCIGGCVPDFVPPPKLPDTVGYSCPAAPFLWGIYPGVYFDHGAGCLQPVVEWNNSWSHASADFSYRHRSAADEHVASLDPHHAVPADKQLAATGARPRARVAQQDTVELDSADCPLGAEGCTCRPDTTCDRGTCRLYPFGPNGSEGICASGPTCGDGTVDEGEECDSGRLLNGPSKQCLSDCRLAHRDDPPSMDDPAYYDADPPQPPTEDIAPSHENEHDDEPSQLAWRVNARLGAVYRVWDNEWDYSPRAGFYGLATASILHPNLVGSLRLSHDRPAVRPAVEGRPIPNPVDGEVTSADVRATTGFGTERFIGSLMGALDLSYLQLDSSAPTQGLQAYDNTLELTLVGTEQLPPDEVEGLHVSGFFLLGADVIPTAQDAVVFLGRTRVGALVDSYAVGEVGAGILGRQDVLLGLGKLGDAPIAWFELHGRVGFAASFTPSGSAMFLPSLGGVGLSQFVASDDYVNLNGMNTVRTGVGTNLYAVTTSAEIGTFFLRFFVEYGQSWGIGAAAERIGLGGVLSMPDSAVVFLQRAFPTMAPFANTVGLYLGGTLQDGFGGRLQLGGLL